MCKLRHPRFKPGLNIKFDLNGEVLCGQIFKILPHSELIYVNTEQWEKESRICVITFDDIIMEI